MTGEVPALRVRAANDAPLRPGDYVLYWMIAARRTRSSYALDRAVEHARALRKPLLIFEPLRLDYPWASQRLHAFVLAGMADNARRCAKAGVAYYPYVEPRIGEGRGLLEALARRACVVVTDDQAAFFLPRMVSAAGAKLPVLLEAVDGVGLLPVRATEKAFARAVDFRRFLQKSWAAHLSHAPSRDPFARARSLPKLGKLPALERWPRTSAEVELGRLPVDASVGPVALRGGSEAAAARLRTFLDHKLQGYLDSKHPDLELTSGLSPYLHFGHIGPHEIWRGLVEREGWEPEAVSERAIGQREGFWGMSAPAEAFVDQLVTWRELGHNACAHSSDFDRFESLPSWARTTLEKHESDRRPVVYTRDQLERAETHDPVWNAAQRELLREGVMHGYLRMLWGKRILEWSASPREALATLLALNDKYALDGRDPNSFSGIFWCLGRYDRPWAPERPVFGQVRYMSSDATVKKLGLRRYLARFAA